MVTCLSPPPYGASCVLKGKILSFLVLCHIPSAPGMVLQTWQGPSNWVYCGGLDVWGRFVVD